MLLALAMVMGLMTAPALAATPTSGKCGKNARWSYNKKTQTLTISGTGTIKGTIEDDGFVGTIWPVSRFNLVIKNGITGISGDSFFDLDIRKLSLPSTLTTIGAYAFYYGEDGMLPATITLPKSVTKIAPGAFYGTGRLKNIKVQKGNRKYTSVGGVLFNKNKTMLHTFPSGKHGTYRIPNGTKVLAMGSFACVELKELTLPASVRTFAADKDGSGISLDTTIKTLRFQGKPPKGLLNDLTDDDHGLEFDHLYYPKKYQKQWKKVEARYRSIMKNDLGYEDGDFTAWQSY